MYRCLGLLFAIVVVAGCNRLPKTGLATGIVYYKGKTVSSCRVTFHDAKGKDSPILADIGPGGRYYAQVPPGEYKLSIKESSLLPNRGKEKNLRLVPEKYNDPETSGLTVTIKRGENRNDFTLTD